MEFKYVFLLVRWVTRVENIVWSEKAVFHTGSFNLPQMPFWAKKQSIEEFAKGSQSRKGLVWKDIHNGWWAYHLSHCRHCEIPWRFKMTEYGQSSGKTLKFFILSKMGHSSLCHWRIWEAAPTFPGMWAGRHDTYEWLPCSPDTLWLLPVEAGLRKKFIIKGHIMWFNWRLNNQWPEHYTCKHAVSRSAKYTTFIKEVR